MVLFGTRTNQTQRFTHARCLPAPRTPLPGLSVCFWPRSPAVLHRSGPNQTLVGGVEGTLVALGLHVAAGLGLKAHIVQTVDRM